MLTRNKSTRKNPFLCVSQNNHSDLPPNGCTVSIVKRPNFNQRSLSFKYLYDAERTILLTLFLT